MREDASTERLTCRGQPACVEEERWACRSELLAGACGGTGRIRECRALGKSELGLRTGRDGEEASHCCCFSPNTSALHTMP